MKELTAEKSPTSPEESNNDSQHDDKSPAGSNTRCATIDSKDEQHALISVGNELDDSPPADVPVYREHKRSPPAGVSDASDVEDKRSPPEDFPDASDDEDKRIPPADVPNASDVEDKLNPPADVPNASDVEDKRSPTAGVSDASDIEDKLSPPAGVSDASDVEDKLSPPAGVLDASDDEDKRSTPEDFPDASDDEDKRIPPADVPNASDVEDKLSLPADVPNATDVEDKRSHTAGFSDASDVEDKLSPPAGVSDASDVGDKLSPPAGVSDASDVEDKRSPPAGVSDASDVEDKRSPPAGVSDDSDVEDRPHALVSGDKELGNKSTSQVMSDSDFTTKPSRRGYRDKTGEETGDRFKTRMESAKSSSYPRRNDRPKPGSECFTLALSQAEWVTIAKRGKLAPYWTDKLYDKYRETTDTPCPLNFKRGYIKKPGSRNWKALDFRASASCRFDDCPCTYEFTVNRVPTTGQVEINVAHVGRKKHTGHTGRYMRGADRAAAAERVKQVGPYNAHQEKLLNAPEPELRDGNTTAAPNASQMPVRQPQRSAPRPGIHPRWLRTSTS